MYLSLYYLVLVKIACAPVFWYSQIIVVKPQHTVLMEILVD